MYAIRRFKRAPIEVLVFPFLLMVGMAYGQGSGPDVVLGPPPGWEVVRLTANDAPFPSFGVHLNDKTHIAWATISSFDPWVENIYLYDNGKITAITDDIGITNLAPFISDDEVIVWTRQEVGAPKPDVVRYQNGRIDFLTGPDTYDGGATIMPTGTIFWSRWFGAGWAELIRYENGVETQITNNGFSNQGVEGDVHGDYVWGRLDFSESPWVGSIMFSLNGKVLQLNDGLTAAQSSDMNVHHHVVWSDGDLWRWIVGDVTLVAEGGRLPTINDDGDIFFFQDDGFPLEPMLYRDEVFYDLGGGIWNTGGGTINNRREVAFMIGEIFVTAVDIYLLWEMRDPGDFDNNHDVDLLDFESFQNCLTGVVPNGFVPETCTRVFDFDDDGDIDFHDFGELQTLFSPAREP